MISLPISNRFLFKKIFQLSAEWYLPITWLKSPHVGVCSIVECEALCDRLAVMVQGQFKCLGSVQQLKAKFGQGYTLIAKSIPDGTKIPNMNPFKQFVHQNFHGTHWITTPLSYWIEVIRMLVSGCKCVDGHHGLVHYEIPSSGMKWSEIFGLLEKAKVQFSLQDYVVGQTTMEQVNLSNVHSYFLKQLILSFLQAFFNFARMLNWVPTELVYLTK